MPCLLFVDDDREIRRALGALLQRHGFEVRGAGSGEEALAALEAPGNEEIDAVLLDVRLPGIDGIAALKQLRATDACRAIPVIAVTASAMPGDRAAITAAGFDACEEKPIDVQRLLATVRALLSRPRTEERP